MHKVKDLMSTSVLSMPKEKGLNEGIKLMAERSISCILITENEKPIGMLTERDLIKKILVLNKDPRETKLEDVMTSNLITTSPEKDLAEVGQMMKDHHIRHLPVVEGDKLVGILTQTDVAHRTHEVHTKNKKFMKWQNIQSIILMLLTIFLVIYLLYIKFVAS